MPPPSSFCHPSLQLAVPIVCPTLHSNSTTQAFIPVPSSFFPSSLPKVLKELQWSNLGPCAVGASALPLSYHPEPPWLCSLSQVVDHLQGCHWFRPLLEFTKPVPNRKMNTSFPCEDNWLSFFLLELEANFTSICTFIWTSLHSL